MVPVERLDVRITWPLWLIVTLLASQYDLHPWSHSCPADRSELCLRAGKMYTSAAPFGISGGTDRRVVCVLVMVDPSGRLTVMHCAIALPF
jgi:hypothetical protein